MPTRLVVMRHATSGWQSPQQPDHDRTLTEEGRHETPRIAKALTDLDYIPDIAYISSSIRTQETCSLLMDVPFEIRPEIYCASLETLRAMVGEIEPNQTTLILGHNPGCELLVATLSGDFHQMPPATCALFIHEDGEWNLEAILRSNELI